MPAIYSHVSSCLILERDSLWTLFFAADEDIIIFLDSNTVSQKQNRRTVFPFEPLKNTVFSNRLTISPERQMGISASHKRQTSLSCTKLCHVPGFL